MDQSTFTSLTGRTLTTGQSQRFDTTSELAGKLLEELLGWPLDPSDWDDQYLERGKTTDEDLCVLDLDDDTELDDPDEVEGSTRLFSWNPHDSYLAIDPALAIHSVKLVSDDVTFKTFESNEYRPRWVNGAERFTRYLQLPHDCYWYNRHLYCCCTEDRQVAIDADWAFEDVPLELQKVWAELIYGDLNLNRNIKSQTLGPHSYTLFTPEEPAVRFKQTLLKYVGPNGTGSRQPRVA